MKGVIILCLKEMICEKFGKDKWEKAVETVGIPKNMLILPISDVDDSTAVSVVKSLCKELGISIEQAADAFGEYWINTYSQRLYKTFYVGKTAKDFLLNMDHLHIRMTKEMESKPPRFTFEWKDGNTLIMHYKSHRGLIDFVVGLAKGVGKFYNQPLSVSKLDEQRVQVIF